MGSTQLAEYVKIIAGFIRDIESHNFQNKFYCDVVGVTINEKGVIDIKIDYAFDTDQSWEIPLEKILSMKNMAELVRKLGEKLRRHPANGYKIENVSLFVRAIQHEPASQIIKGQAFFQLGLEK